MTSGDDDTEIEKALPDDPEGPFRPGAALGNRTPDPFITGKPQALWTLGESPFDQGRSVHERPGTSGRVLRRCRTV